MFTFLHIVEFAILFLRFHIYIYKQCKVYNADWTKKMDINNVAFDPLISVYIPDHVVLPLALIY
jgi:hypothetical protein